MRNLVEFEGRWRLDRPVEDRATGTRGRFEGHAVMTRSGAVLRYREEGVLTLGPGSPMAAGRRYLWRQDGARIAVDFADGRAFHAFDAGTARPEAHHQCPPDSYDVAYDFTLWPVWTARWRVRGPRKDYTMLGRYAPA